MCWLQNGWQFFSSKEVLEFSLLPRYVNGFTKWSFLFFTFTITPMVHPSHQASRFLSFINFTLSLLIYSISLPLTLLLRCANHTFVPKLNPSPDRRTHYHKPLPWLTQPIANAYFSHNFTSQHNACCSNHQQRLAIFPHLNALSRHFLARCTCANAPGMCTLLKPASSLVKNCLMWLLCAADFGGDNLNNVAQ